MYKNVMDEEIQRALEEAKSAARACREAWKAEDRTNESMFASRRNFWEARAKLANLLANLAGQ